MEQQTKQSIRKVSGQVAIAVLLGVGIVGAVGAAAICPNLLQLIPLSERRRYSHRAIKQAVHRLDKRGLIVARQIADGWKIHLTKKGHAEFLEFELGKKGITVPRRWDKKWRLLVFDIPEKRKYIREKVRRFLLSLGFYRLQDSVWVHPYECRDVLDLLRTKYQIRSEALYVSAHSIDNDHWLRKHFGLK